MTDETAGDPATGPTAAPPRFAPPSGPPSPEPADAPGYGSAPEDGSALGHAPAPRPPLNGLAVAALICGILGLAPAAIVLGHVGFAQARRSGQRGRGLAIAGFLLGYLALVLLLVGALAYSAFVGGLRSDGFLPA
ncbi:DUF4190 domain-containing protein [Rathayibacter sp. VKM Ac-2760]|uniref:DUF4190 domain-containing protein n=1 Tax=Rathayibacter sp. VKM Ac-2760 TaxID=2609253 RepID=UPI001317F449|nr:DUF4190 domain-containing protein [Rathayibacter sp. VKM Ac-2760]QHC59723.1 DUF4190 domain-containing protein [Rathayibacter sp. VKM Ac-2760]